MDFLNNITKDLSIDKVRNLAEDAINQAKPKTDTEKRVYEVLSHKNWGASSTLLNEIARDTYDFEKFNTIINLMWDGMANRPAAWRVVFKALTLLEHLLKNGSERCVDSARGHQHQISGLLNFNYYEEAVDRGAGVREKAKQIIELLADNERIREERQRAAQLREKFGGASGNMPSSDFGGGGFSSGSGGGGYGNSGIGSSSGGGYGNSGIGSSSGGGYGNSGIGSSSNSGTSAGFGYGGKSSGSGSEQNFSGRYAEKKSFKDDVVPPPPLEDTAKPKKKGKKKKKAALNGPSIVEMPAAPAPAVDLLAFDQASPPAPAGIAPPPSADVFDAFGSGQDTIAATPAVVFDAFGSGSEPPTFAPPASDDFGDFSGSAVAAPAPVDDFGDFSASTTTPAPATGFTSGMGAGVEQMQNMSGMFPGIDGMSMMSNQGTTPNQGMMPSQGMMPNQGMMLNQGMMGGMGLQQVPQAMGMNMGMQQNFQGMVNGMQQPMQGMGMGMQQPANTMGGLQPSGKNVMGGSNVMAGGVRPTPSNKTSSTESNDFGDFSPSGINEDNFMAGQLDSLAASKFTMSVAPKPPIGGGVGIIPGRRKNTSGDKPKDQFNSFAGIDGLPVKIGPGDNNKTKSKLSDRPVMARGDSGRNVGGGNGGSTGAMGMGSGQAMMGGGGIGMMPNQQMGMVQGQPMGGMMPGMGSGNGMPNQGMMGGQGMMPGQGMSMQQQQMMMNMMMGGGMNSGMMSTNQSGAPMGMMQGMSTQQNMGDFTGGGQGGMSMGSNSKK